MNEQDMTNVSPVVMADATVRTVTLGMGCFWSPEALFGALPGVVTTRVGYAGGTSPQPDYRRMGDHSETVEIGFNSRLISLEEILNAFWNNHNPVNINDYKGRQYRSILFYRDGTQKEAIDRVKGLQESAKGPLDTEISPFSAFYPAEERHQKYYLKRFPDAVRKLGSIYPSPADLENSTLAARLNGLAKGYTNLERILQEIPQWPIRPEIQVQLSGLIRQIRW